MRVNLIHDHKFMKVNGKYYSSGKFTINSLSNYFVGLVDNMQLFGRVITKDKLNGNINELTSPKIKVSTMGFLKRKSDFVFKKNKIEKFLKERIDENDINIVRLPSEIGYIAINYFERSNLSYGIELVGDPWDALWYHSSVSAKVMAFINMYKTKRIVAKSKNTIYVTKYYLQNRYPTKGNEFVASNVQINDITMRYKNRNINGLKIGMIGSLDTKYKGIETALKAISSLKDAINIKFEIVGNGKQVHWNKRIKQMDLESIVELKGSITSGEPILKWLSTLDLYIQPSYTEGLPRSLVEAMSVGLPCLGSNAGGIPELIDDKFIHKIKDFNKLSKDIEKVNADYNLRSRMSVRNIDTAKNYTLNKINKERERFVLSILKEHFNEK